MSMETNVATSRWDLSRACEKMDMCLCMSPPCFADRTERVTALLADVRSEMSPGADYNISSTDMWQRLCLMSICLFTRTQTSLDAIKMSEHDWQPAHDWPGENPMEAPPPRCCSADLWSDIFGFSFETVGGSGDTSSIFISVHGLILKVLPLEQS